MSLSCVPYLYPTVADYTRKRMAKLLLNVCEYSLKYPCQNIWFHSPMCVLLSIMRCLQIIFLKLRWQYTTVLPFYTLWFEFQWTIKLTMEALMELNKWIFRYNIWLSRHLILYNMNKFHDNIVFQIDEKYSTLLFKCHFAHHFYIVVLCSYQRCVTLRYRSTHRSNKTCDDWIPMCRRNQPPTFMCQERRACGVSCEAMQGRDTIRRFPHSQTAFDEFL